MTAKKGQKPKPKIDDEIEFRFGLLVLLLIVIILSIYGVASKSWIPLFIFLALMILLALFNACRKDVRKPVRDSIKQLAFVFELFGYLS